MKNIELLEKIRITSGYFTDEPRLSIIKTSKGGIAEIAESRALDEKEIMTYLFILGQHYIKTNGTNNAVSILHNAKHLQLNIRLEDLSNREE